MKLKTTKPIHICNTTENGTEHKQISIGSYIEVSEEMGNYLITKTDKRIAKAIPTPEGELNQPHEDLTHYE